MAENKDNAFYFLKENAKKLTNQSDFKAGFLCATIGMELDNHCLTLGDQFKVLGNAGAA